MRRRAVKALRRRFAVEAREIAGANRRIEHSSTAQAASQVHCALGSG
jgi:hypothetical protein